MLSCISLLIYQHVVYSGVLANVMPWKIWFCWMGAAVVETIAWFIFLVKVGDKRK